MHIARFRGVCCAKKLLLSNAETAIRGKRFCGVYGKAPKREWLLKETRASAYTKERKRGDPVTSVISSHKVEILKQRAQGA